jgi:hypothetical protein
LEAFVLALLLLLVGGYRGILCSKRMEATGRGLTMLRKGPTIMAGPLFTHNGTSMLLTDRNAQAIHLEANRLENRILDTISL